MKPSKLKRKESTLGQRRFWEHQLRAEKDFEKHLDYIHYNPVKHGLAKQVLDWPYSTFYRYSYVQNGVYGNDWAGISSEEQIVDEGEPWNSSLVHGMHPTWLTSVGF